MSGAESGIEGSTYAPRRPGYGDTEGGVWLFVSEAEQKEIDALMASIDAKLVEAEERADRMLAAMGLS